MMDHASFQATNQAEVSSSACVSMATFASGGDGDQTDRGTPAALPTSFSNSGGCVIASAVGPDNDMPGTEINSQIQPSDPNVAKDKRRKRQQEYLANKRVKNTEWKGKYNAKQRYRRLSLEIRQSMSFDDYYEKWWPLRQSMTFNAYYAQWSHINQQLTTISTPNACGVTVID